MISNTYVNYRYDLVSYHIAKITQGIGNVLIHIKRHEKWIKKHWMEGQFTFILKALQGSLVRIPNVRILTSVVRCVCKFGLNKVHAKPLYYFFQFCIFRMWPGSGWFRFPVGLLRKRDRERFQNSARLHLQLYG